MPLGKAWPWRASLANLAHHRGADNDVPLAADVNATTSRAARIALRGIAVSPMKMQDRSSFLTLRLSSHNIEYIFAITIIGNDYD